MFDKPPCLALRQAKARYSGGFLSTIDTGQACDEACVAIRIATAPLANCAGSCEGGGKGQSAVALLLWYRPILSKRIQDAAAASSFFRRCNFAIFQ